MEAHNLLNILTNLEIVTNNTALKTIELNVKSYIQPFSVVNVETNKLIPKVDGFLHGKIIHQTLNLLEKHPHDSLISLAQKLTQGSMYPMLYESLQVLADKLKKSSEPFTSLIINLLEEIIKSDTLYLSIVTACRPIPRTAIEQAEFQENWRSFSQLLVSLPSLLANKTQGKVNKYFPLDNYAKIIIYHTTRAVKYLNNTWSQLNINPDVQLISSLISKSICHLGSSNFTPLVDILSSWSLKNNQNINEFIYKIFKNLERSSVESVATLLLKRTKNPSDVDIILRDLLRIDQWRYVLTVKIPLLSFHDSELLIKNLVFYLSSSLHENRPLVDLVMKLLNIWGDRSVLNHSSIEHHEFISKFILLSVLRLKNQFTVTEKEQVQRLMFDGTSVHLESMQLEIRILGMITGELILEILSQDGPKLKYEYPENQVVVERFRKLVTEGTVATCSTDGDELLTNLGLIFKEQLEKLEPVKKEQIEVKEEKENKEEMKVDEELDSDDDLIPYDLSNDTPIGEKLKPTYLRDLRDNLVNHQANKDPDIFSESMRVAEDLILKQLPSDDKSLGLELLRILMTLKEEVYTEGFHKMKFNACVAVVLVYPKEAAEFLCASFHAGMGEFSVADRIFFLSVLAEAARRLSKVEVKHDDNVDDSKDVKKVKQKRNSKVSLMIERKKHETLYDEDFEVVEKEEKRDWEEIVQRRIESNTRRFAHESKRPKTTVNKFNDVATEFFYPLLFGVMQKKAYLYKLPDQFVDTDNILLVEFLKTLSTIMVAAENCVAAGKIAKDLMELAWTLRYHEEAKVRMCVIENIAAVIVTLKKENLGLETVELMMEFRSWLIDVSVDSVRGDPNSNCRSLGRNVVALIDSVVGETFKN